MLAVLLQFFLPEPFVLVNERITFRALSLKLIKLSNDLSHITLQDRICSNNSSEGILSRYLYKIKVPTFSRKPFFDFKPLTQEFTPSGACYLPTDQSIFIFYIVKRNFISVFEYFSLIKKWKVSAGTKIPELLMRLYK